MGFFFFDKAQWLNVYIEGSKFRGLRMGTDKTIII
jgi:hypothetical protein